MQHSSLTLSLIPTLLAGLLLSGTVLAEKKFHEGHILVKAAAGLSEEKFDKVLKKANPRGQVKAPGLPRAGALAVSGFYAL